MVNGQRCWLIGASSLKGFQWKLCLPLARVLGLSSRGAEDQEVVWEAAWRDVVVFARMPGHLVSHILEQVNRK